MTVGDVCKLLRPNDLIIIHKGNDFACGFVEEMESYYKEIICHLKADKSAVALGCNDFITYSMDVLGL